MLRMLHNIFSTDCVKMLSAAREAPSVPSRTIIKIVALTYFAMLIGNIIDVSDAKSTTKGHSDTSRWLPRERYRRSGPPGMCGSRLVDALNVLCRTRFYEPRLCEIAQRHYCNRGRGVRTAMCIFRCGSVRRSTRSTDARLGSDRAENYTTELALLASTFSGHHFQDESASSPRRSSKSKRHPNALSRCCRGECPLSHLQRYCARGS